MQLATGSVASGGKPVAGRPAACCPKQPASKRHEGNGLVASSLTLPALQEENKQLRALLQTIDWPPINWFEAFGRKHLLPFNHGMPSTASKTGEVEACRLRYLAGFFDGDGCCCLHKGSFFMQVSQSFDRADVLMLFQSAFSGGIYRSRNGRGLRKPILYWRAGGDRAAVAARLLAPYSMVKKKQLELGLQWPANPEPETIFTEKLRGLKHQDSCVEAPCSWQYVAGFFDAEGHIQLAAKCALRLLLSQKFVNVLMCLRRYLASELGCDPYLRQSQCAFTLDIGPTPVCKRFLRNVLAAGMVQKAPQARLALAVTHENTSQIRRALFDLTGQQAFGRRQDDQGRDLARKVRNAKGRAKYAAQTGQQAKESVALEEIEMLSSELALHKARLENVELQAFVVKLSNLQREA